MHESDDQVVNLASFGSEIEATMIADELQREGIQAQASGLLTAGFRAEAPGQVKVLIHIRDLDRARELLDDYIKSKQQIDWSKVDLASDPEQGAGNDDASQ